MKQKEIVTWKLYTDCESEKEYEFCIYAWVKGKTVLYVGRAKKFDVRYAGGYVYLIKLLLESGYQLYISSKIANKANWDKKSRKVEGALINEWCPKHNKNKKPKDAIANSKGWKWIYEKKRMTLITRGKDIEITD
jgi:hypothetical protein